MSPLPPPSMFSRVPFRFFLSASHLPQVTEIKLPDTRDSRKRRSAPSSAVLARSPLWDAGPGNEQRKGLRVACTWGWRLAFPASVFSSFQAGHFGICAEHPAGHVCGTPHEGKDEETVGRKQALTC